MTAIFIISGLSLILTITEWVSIYLEIKLYVSQTCYYLTLN